MQMDLYEKWKEVVRMNQEYRRLEKKVLYYMYIKTGVLDVVSIIVLGVIYHFLPWQDHYITFIYYVLIGLSILDLVITPYYKYKNYRYQIDKDCIYVKEGFIKIVERIVPIERIHNIEIEKGPFLQVFHLAKVTVITAGGEVSISMIDEIFAESISEKLRDKINEIVRLKKEEVKMEVEMEDEVEQGKIKSMEEKGLKNE